MSLFKKNKKKSSEQKYYEDLVEQIGFSAAKGKCAIYVPVKDEEEDWLITFCSAENYKIRARIMKIFKKWFLSSVQDELNKAEARAEYWKKEFEDADKTIKQLLLKITKQDELLQSRKQQISELEDEIDIQKCKAAKYLSHYLKEMEKHAPND